MDCLFCKIAKKEIASHIIYEDDTVLAFLDIHPKVDGHTLIIPKKHVEDFTTLDKETLYHMKEVAQKLSNMLMEKLNKQGMTLTMNYKDAQEIKHVHLHLLPNLHQKTKLHSIEEIKTLITNEKSQ